MPEHVLDPPQSSVEDGSRGLGANEEGGEESYSLDGEAFESYSVDESDRNEELEMEVESKLDSSGVSEGGKGQDSSAGEDAESESSEEERAVAPPPQHHTAMDRRAKTKRTRQHDAVRCTYDEHTYSIVQRLRAQNKRLVSQLEQQCKLLESLTEEKKQQQQLIQTLRADLALHKQTIHALQTAGPQHHRQHEKELLANKYAARLERVETERKEQAARHAHQVANYSHELSRLERQLEHAHRALQEKENALRLQRARQLYHSPTHSAGGSSSMSGGQPTVLSKRRDSPLHGRNSIFADDIWRELLPVPPVGPTESEAEATAGPTALEPDTSASGFSSRVGLAFEQLVSHPLMALHDVTLDASAREWLLELRACGSQMLELHAAFQALGRALKSLAESCSTYQLADALTRESRALVQAEQALVFVVDKAEQEFWCRVPRPAGVSSEAQAQMVTVRSKLLPFGTQAPTPTSASCDAGKPSWSAPCGLASMVFHSKRPLLLAAGQAPKHACFSPNANESTDRLVDHPSASTLLVPVIHDGHVLAVVQVVGKMARVEALGLSISLEKRDSFSAEDQALLSLLSHFSSGLLPKVAYFSEVESNKVNEETLIQLAPEIFTCLRFDELGKVVIENAKEILDADRCSLFVADTAERMLFNWQSDISGAGVEVLDAARKATMSIPFGHGIVGLVAETWQPINIVDAYEDPRFNSAWDKKTNYRTKSMLTVPILSNAIRKQPSTRGGPGGATASPASAAHRRPPSQMPAPQTQHTEQTLLGVVQVINKSGGAPFRSKDEFLLQTITKLIALAIENSQLFQKNQALCWDVGRLIADGDLVEALTSLGASAEEIIGVESACVYVVDDASNELVTFHRKRRYRIALKEKDYRGSLLGSAIASQQMLIANDVETSPHFNAFVDSIGGVAARNVLFAPLLVDDPELTSSIVALTSPSNSSSSPPASGKKLVGLLHLVNTKGRKLQFDRHDLFLSIVHSQTCSVVASILEKHEMLREKAQVTRLLDTSMSFFKEMSPVGVMNAVYNSCTAIFRVEKAHLFLWEPDKRYMWTSKLSPSAAAMAGGHLQHPGALQSAIGLEGGSPQRRETKLTPSFIPTLSVQARRISVLTNQRLRAPTTEGLLEKVLAHGSAVIVREWIELPATRLEEDGDADADVAARAASRANTCPRPAGRYAMQAAASDVRLGFTKHSVLACPVWDHYGLEVVGVLVLLFRRGHTVQHSEELANLPILSRQIAGALNVCSDLSLVSARCRQMQGMLELSRRKAEGAMSLTLSARGSLVSFSQPVNVATAAFNVLALKAVVHGAQALNAGVSLLPMDEDGNRWCFQLSGMSIADMQSEHYVQWMGKRLASDGSAFDQLVTDLQGVYQRKEVRRGGVDCGASSSGVGDDGASWSSWSLPKDVVVQLRQLLWTFTDAEWDIDTARAVESLFPGAHSAGSSVSRLQLEQTLGRHVRLDQVQWDLLHARFADPASDLVDVAAMLAALRPRVRVFRGFRYELAPMQDPVTQSVIGAHVLLREGGALE